ncbi:LytTR family transcriptional regulator [Porphyrobacter sp. TH134]|uniref:LytTR family DNA-binding domain-containing protein n=1 Tax=Porphyrobacter sp. TH134 TaxID=2067450 RepID=UPI000C7D7B4A|nr:LytTR family DNA-binding domain-containing protein [Porphyrobacter sp. TH134]PLK22414.1 LytTR family transcriptional regulator [Porphyrobacter sp. TH134]
MLKVPDPAAQPGEPLPPPSALTLWLCASAGVWAMYLLVFLQVPGNSLEDCAIYALINVAPLTVLAAGVHWMNKRYLMQWSVAAQIIGHIAAGALFAVAWFALVTFLLEVRSAYISGGALTFAGFTDGAFIWQALQGLVLYWAVAATTYAVRGGRSAAPVTIVSAPPLERYLTRKGDEIAPVNVRDIIMIAGAQDYAEVTTPTDTHLVRMSLSEFEQRLDPQRFIRVHRSRIINIDHLDYAEPAGGGRLIARMTNGTSVPLSRTGSQALRSLIV